MAQWEEGSEEAEALSSESEEESQELVVRALRSYCSELDDSEVASTNLLQVTNYINTSCLICLSGIKRIQAVWNCKFCYTCFHLVCIQHWAKDGVVNKVSILSEALFPGILSKWTCPKCRAEYDQADTPSVYQCFCGKEVFRCLFRTLENILFTRLTHLLIHGCWHTLVGKSVDAT